MAIHVDRQALPRPHEPATCAIKCRPDIPKSVPHSFLFTPRYYTTELQVYRDRSDFKAVDITFAKLDSAATPIEENTVRTRVSVMAIPRIVI